MKVIGISRSNNNINFGKKRKKNTGKRGYTPEEKKLRHEINTAAFQKKWRDIYSGRRFTKNSIRSTVEHIIPFSLKKTAVIPKGFEINGLDNLFPAGIKGNRLRKNERFAATVSKNPIILDRLLTELNKYKKYNSPLINGKEWANRLLQTVLREIEGACCDLATRKISFKKII